MAREARRGGAVQSQSQHVSTPRGLLLVSGFVQTSYVAGKGGRRRVSLLVFGTAGAHRLLGFHNSSTNPFIAGTLQSVKAVSMMFTDALYLHCDLLNSNIDKRAGDGSMFHLSTAFAKLMVNTSPFNNIIFQTF